MPLRFIHVPCTFGHTVEESGIGGRSFAREAEVGEGLLLFFGGTWEFQGNNRPTVRPLNLDRGTFWSPKEEEVGVQAQVKLVHKKNRYLLN